MFFTRNKKLTKVFCAALAALLALYVFCASVYSAGGSPVIRRFVSDDPVLQITAEPGTDVSALGLPDSLMAVVALPEGVIPDYITPAAFQPTPPAGCGSCVFGFYPGKDGGEWFSLDPDGGIDGILTEIPVTWLPDGYDPGIVGEYIFTADFHGFAYASARPFAIVTVGELSLIDGLDIDPYRHCDCAVDEDYPSSAHDPGCPWYHADCDCELHLNGPAPEGEIHGASCPWYAAPAASAASSPVTGDELPSQADQASSSTWGGVSLAAEVKCTCREELTITVSDPRTKQDTQITVLGAYTHIHDPNNPDCPLYAAEVAQNFRAAAGSLDINDAEAAAFMRENTPVSGAAAYELSFGFTVPGSWRDYVNRLWIEDIMPGFSWAPGDTTGSISAWSGSVSSETSGSARTNPKHVPEVSDGYYIVYSGEQLRYALTNTENYLGVRLGADIDLNGAQFSWTPVTAMGTDLGFSIDGAGHTIYNLGITSSTELDGGNAHFFRYIACDTGSLTVTDITFKNARIINERGLSLSEGESGSVAIFGATSGGYAENVTVENSQLYYAAADDTPRLGVFCGWTNSYFTNCYAVNNTYYGRSHVSALFSSCDAVITNSFALGSKICATGGHVSGLAGSGAVKLSGCFSSGDIYAPYIVSGLGEAGPSIYGAHEGGITDCFTTGKIEGLCRLSGISYGPCELTRAYSTMLVGQRDKGSQLGGLAGILTSSSALSLHDCYAAGEVGGPGIDLSSPVGVGALSNLMSAKGALTSCYYDRQTTVAGDWITGDRKTVTGALGVLTASAQSDDGVITAGLAGGPSDAAAGFTGFTDETKWVFTQGQYPQLAVFAQADTKSWGSADKAAQASAWSRASVAAVFMDTWDDLGVGFENTRDTIRDAVRGLTLSPGVAAHFDGEVFEATKTGGLLPKTAGCALITLAPESEDLGASRPVRLYTLMSLGTLEDREITAGSTYDGLGDIDIKTLDVSATALKTEIWRASLSKTGEFVTDAENGVGREGLVPQAVVALAGLNSLEDVWNGTLPFFSDTGESCKYIVVYTLSLADGRTVSADRTVTVLPGEYEMDTAVRFLGIAGGNAVTLTRVDLTAADGTLLGAVSIEGALRAGQTVTVPVTLYSTKTAWSEERGEYAETLLETPVMLSFAVSRDVGGSLKLTRLSDESAGGSIMFNTTLTVFTGGAGSFKMPVRLGGNGLLSFTVIGTIIVAAAFTPLIIRRKTAGKNAKGMRSEGNG